MNELSLIQNLIVWIPPVLLAVTLHEYGHGWMAKRLGDRTAEMMGRLTINPIKHIDPIGTVVVPAIMLMTGGFIFGWAKPVPITYQNLNNPKKDMAMVALAGPGANLIMLICWAILIKVATVLPPSVGTMLILMGQAGILINCILMLLNLLPIPPLDGSRILMSYLPGPLSYKLAKLEPYGLFIILGLLLTGVLGKILNPMLMGVLKLTSQIMGVPL